MNARGSTLGNNCEDMPATRKFYDPVLELILENMIPVLDNTSLFCKLF